MSRSPASFALPVIVLAIALLGASCARSTTLGPEEAVEVMVLDGIERARAVCIVQAMGGDVDLAKVSGLDVDLSDDELRLLATTSAQCAPALALNGTMVIGGVTLDEATIAAQMVAADSSVEDQVAALVEQGLELAVGQCLESRLGMVPDPHDVLADLRQRSELIVECRIDLGLDDLG